MHRLVNKTKIKLILCQLHESIAFNSPLPSPPPPPTKTIVTCYDSCFANCGFPLKTLRQMIIAEERESSCQYQGKKAFSTQFDEINFIYLLLFWKKYHKEIEFVTSHLCQVCLSKLISDTFGIWIPIRDFWIPDSDFKRDSAFLELYAELHKKKIPGFRDTECLTGGETSVFTSVQEWSAPC